MRTVDWIEELMLRHKDKVLRVASTILGNITDAEDVFQDTFIKLFEKQPIFESEKHEAAWLIKVVVNLSKNKLRSFWRKNTIPLLDTYSAKNDEQHELIDIVMSLPVKYKLVIHLFYFEGYSIDEIASITGQKYSTVGNQLSRARQMLKKYIEEEI